jgi:biopolymer transport protein ExbD
MRFARHAQIFRGPMDPAPVAGVMLLLMMFMLLGSLVYTPGVLIELGQAITVTSSNVVRFAGKSYTPGELDLLRAALRTAPGNAGFSVVMQPGADPGLGRQISNLFQIALPDGNNLVGTDNATVVVEVNFRGQFFYENRLVQDAELKTELALRLKMAARNAEKLTLILRMDKAAETQVLTHLRELAGEVGITEVVLAGRPAPFGGQP